jgi:hypothetical protein
MAQSPCQTPTLLGETLGFASPARRMGRHHASLTCGRFAFLLRVAQKIKINALVGLGHML